jgi:hypothetical protein
MSPFDSILNGKVSLDAVLSAVTRSPEVEAEWLNHLSQLEYVGCRKILKAVPFEKIDLLTLQHIHEESGHAFLLKEAAGKLLPSIGGFAQTRLSQPGWNYFRELDFCVSDMLPLADQHLAYAFVSFIVEERVMVLYPAYRAKTTHSVVRDALKIILAQEGRHETRFGRWVKKDIQPSTIAQAQQLEEKLWHRFCEEVCAVVNQPSDISGHTAICQ